MDPPGVNTPRTETQEPLARTFLPSYVRGTHGAFIPVWELHEGHQFKDRHTMDFITEYSPQSILNIVEQHPLYEDNGLQITGTAMTLHRPKAKLDRVDSFYVLEELHKSSLLTSLSNSRPKSSGLPTITVSRQRAEPGTPRGPVQLETLDIAKEKRRLTAEKRRRRRRSRRVSPSLSITSSVSELSSHDGSIAESHTEYEQL